MKEAKLEDRRGKVEKAITKLKELGKLSTRTVRRQGGNREVRLGSRDHVRTESRSKF